MVYKVNFRKNEFLLFNAAIGITYAAIVSKYQLIDQSSLNLQMGALAVSTAIGCQILGTKRVEKQYFCVLVPFIILGGATLFTNESLKTKILSTVILSSAQVITGNLSTQVEKI